MKQSRMKTFNMKKILLISWLTLFAVCINAQSIIRVGDFYYKIISVPNKTVKIVRGEIPYKGHLEIPSTIQYSGRVFKVISMSEAFFRNEDIVSVHIPGTFEKIEANAFDQCKNLSKIQIDEGVKEIGDDAFRKTAIPSINLPSSVKTLCYGCFAGCSRLRKIDMPGVEDVSLNVFNGCSSLVDLTFPSTLVKLAGLGGIAGCVALRTITFNSAVYWAGKIENCPNIIQITSNTRTPKSNSAFHSGTMDTKTTIAVPKGCISIYESTSGWNNFLHMKEIDRNPIPSNLSAKELNDLGNEYFDGENNRAINYQKASECYQKAMEMGYPEAYFNMAYNKEFGLGMASNLKEAAQLYNEAIKKGVDYGKVYKHLERLKVEVPEAAPKAYAGNGKKIEVQSFRQEVSGYRCKIKWIECAGLEMIVHGSIEPQKSSGIWWPKTVYIKTKDGEKKRAIRAEGIPFEPKTVVVEPGKPLEFRLVFSKLPEGTTQFDLIESDKPDSWKFFDITLKEPIL